MQAENDNEPIQAGERLFAYCQRRLAACGNPTGSFEPVLAACTLPAGERSEQTIDLLYDLFSCEALAHREYRMVPYTVRTHASLLQAELLQEQGLEICLTLLGSNFDTHADRLNWNELANAAGHTIRLQVWDGMMDAFTAAARSAPAADLKMASRYMDRLFQNNFPPPWEQLGEVNRLLKQRELHLRGATPLHPSKHVQRDQPQP